MRFKSILAGIAAASMAAAPAVAAPKPAPVAVTEMAPAAETVEGEQIRGGFLLPLAITADLQSLVSNAFSLLTNNNKEVLVRLQGNVRAGRGGVFIGVPVRYEGKQRIRF